MSDKNIVVLGCGYWGKNIIRNFSELGYLYGVADIDRSVSNSFSELYKVKDFTIKEALGNDEVDAVAICTPAETHVSLALEAIKKGKHVFVEKPLALNIQDSKKLKKVSNDMNKKLMVGHLLQYHPAFEKVLNMIELGFIGNVKKIFSERMSFGKVRKHEDVIWSFAPHDISMVLAITKELPTKVSCDGQQIISNNLFDSASINLLFNDIAAQIDVSWIHPIKRHCLTVIGEDGMIVFDDTKEWEEKVFYQKYSLHKENELIKGDHEYIKIEKKEPLRQECKYFIDLLNGKKDSRTGADEGVQVVTVLCQLTA